MAALVTAVLVVTGLLVVVPQAPTAEGAAYATGGTGQHRDILWLTWGGGVNGTANAPLSNGSTSTASIVVGDQTLVTTCTLGSIDTNYPPLAFGGGLAAYRPGDWGGDYFDDLYNINGTGNSNQLIAGITNTVNGRGLTFTTTCRATLGGEPFELPGMVFADAEQSASNEFVQGSGIGQFSLIERGRSCPEATNSMTVTQSGNRQTLRLSGVNATCQGPTAISYLNFADAAYTGTDRQVQMNFEVRGGGKSAIAIGIIAPIDIGDAPASYGRASHVITPTASPTLGTRPATNTWNLPLATLALPSLRLGSLLDADGALVGNAAADADDVTGLDDEDGVAMPAALDAGTTVPIPVEVGAAGQLNAWMDWNRDGDFDDADERIATNLAVSAGTTTLSVAVPLTAVEGQSYARFRLCRLDECTTASSAAGWGEAEDYAFQIRSATLTIIKEAVPQTSQSFAFSSSSTRFGASFILDDDETTPVPDRRGVVVPPGTITVRESDVTGWTLTDLVCADPNGSSRVSLEDLTATAVVNPGEDVVCTFTNTRDEPALGILKSATVAMGDDGVAQAGEVVTYTYRVTNTGNVPVEDVTVAEQVATFTGTGTLPTPAHVSGGGDLDGEADATDLAAGETAVFAATYTLTQADIDAGSITNQALAQASGPDGQPLQDLSDPGSLTGDEPTVTPLGQLPGLTLTKTAAQTSFTDAGQPIDYTFELTNTGNVTLTGVTLTDPLPGLSTPVCTDTGGDTVPLPTTLAPGSGLSCTATYTTADADLVAGEVQNTATADSDQAEPSTSTVTVPAEYADLRVTKTVSNDPFVPGRPLTYTVVVTNLGTVDAADVQLTDVIPAGLTVGAVTTPTGTCASDGTSCSLGTLAAGASVTVTISGVTAPDATELSNTATVTTTTPDPYPDNDSDTVVTPGNPAADLQVVKTGPATVTAGTNITYTVSVTNRGPSDAADVVVIDTPAAPLVVHSMTVQSSGETCTDNTCALGTVAAGATETIVVVASVPPGATGEVTNTATIESPTRDPVPGNDTSSWTTPVTTSADVSVSKLVTSPSVPGEDREWTVTVRNSGPSDAQGVVVTDSLPPGVTFVSDGGTGLCVGDSADPEVVTCDLGTLPVGDQVVLTVTGAVDPDVTGDLTNDVEVVSETPDQIPGNNSAQATDTPSPEADVVVSKSGPATAVPGTAVSWTVVVANNGPSTATDVVLQDPAPAGVTFTAATATGGVTCSTDVSCVIGDMAPGASVAVTVTGTIAPDATGELVNVATVTSPTDPDDPEQNTSTTTTVLEPSADTSITKESDISTYVPGESFTFYLQVRNNGPSTATGVEVSDPLADIVSLVSATPSAGQCEHTGEAAGGEILCALGDLEPGAVVTIAIVVDVDPAALGAVDNVATVSSQTFDPAPGNNSDDEVFVADPVADLVVDKSGPATALAGTEVSYTVVVTNAGPSVSHDVVLDELAPTGLDLSGVELVSGPGACDGTSCAIEELGVGESTTLTVTGTIEPTFTGDLTNVAQAAAGTPDPDDSNDSDDAVTTVRAEADLAVVKTASATSVAAGTQVSYTLTVTNTGPSTAIAAVLTDTLPPGQSVVSLDPAADCADVDGTITCQLGDLAPGAEVEVTVVAQVAADAAEGTVRNVGVVGSSTPDPDPADNTSQVPVDIVRAADLSVVKDAVAETVAPGEQTSFTLLVRNDGPSDAQAARITDVLPEGMLFVASDAACSADGQTVSCQLGALAAGAEVEVTITVQVSAAVADGAVLLNEAGVGSATPDPEPGNDTDDAQVTAAASADLAISKTPDDETYTPGAEATFTITVENLGPSDAPAVVVTDVLPEGTSFVSATADCVAEGAVTCAIGALPAGESVTFTLTVLTDAALMTEIVNTASVSSAVADPVADNDSDTGTLQPAAAADVSVVKTAAGTTIGAGTSMTYTLLVANAGPSLARDVAIADVAPAGSTIVSATPTVAGAAECTADAARADCTVAELAPGAEVSITLVLALAADYTDPTFANTATVSTSTTDPVEANDTSTSTLDVVQAVDLAVAKSVFPTSAPAGSTATWTLTVTNAGPAVATDVVLTDTLPAGFTATSVTSSWDGATCGVTGQVVTCEAAAMTADDELVVTVAGTLAADLAEGTLTNDAEVSSAVLDTNPGNDTDSAELAVTSSANLVLTKTAQEGDVVPGAQRTWTIQVVNAGPSVARDVVVTDELVDGLTFVSDDLGACTADGQTVTCALGDLPVAAEPVVIELTADVDPSLTEPVSNTATVTSSSDDPDPSDNTDTSTDDVAPLADVSVGKSVVEDQVVAGQQMTYQLVVRNEGTSTAADVVLTDQLPEQVTFVSVSDEACEAVDGLLTCALEDLLPGAIVTVDVVVEIGPGVVTPIENTAEVATATEESDLQNNTDTISTTPLASADVTVVKTASAETVLAGTSLSYQIVVTNEGPSTATDVVATDTLPAGMSVTSVTPADACVEDGTAVRCDLGDLTPGASVTITVDAEVAADTAAGTLTNAATVSSGTPDPDPQNTSEVPVEVVRAADLSIVKEAGSATVAPGEEATYTLTVSNAGPSTADVTRVVDTLPAGMSFVSAAPESCEAADTGFACALGTLAVGGAVEIVVTVAVAADVADGAELVNTASVSSSTPDLDGTDNTDEASVVAAALADLQLVKTPDDGSYTPGTNAAFSLTVTNLGPSDATEVTVLDTLPAGVTFVSSTPDCEPGEDAQVLTCDLATIAAGGSATIELTVATAPDLLEDVVNTASVSSAVEDLNPANDTDTGTLVAAPEAGLSVVKVAEVSSVGAGTEISYTLSVWNAGPSLARDVLLADIAPEGTTIVSATPVVADGVSCEPSATLVECTVAELAAGASFDVTLVLAVDPGYADDALANTATVSAPTPDPNLTDNASTATVDVTRAADVWVTKAATPAQATAGATATWQIVIGNDGPAHATAVALTDALPAGFTAGVVRTAGSEAECTVTEQDLACDAASLPVGEQVVVTVVGTVGSDLAHGSTLTNTASVSSAVDDLSTSNNTATADLEILTSADLVLTKTAQDGDVVPGENRTWTIAVVNAGPSIARDAVVTDVLAEGLTFLSDSAGACSADGQTVTCALGDLPVSDDPVLIEVTAAVDPSVTGPVSNSAVVTSTTTDPDEDNNTGTSSDDVDPSAALSVSKTVAEDAVVAGGQMTYQLTVRNDGSSTAAQVVLTDELPEQVSAVSLSHEACSAVGGVVTCELGDLLPGAIVSVDLVVEIDPDNLGEIVNTATVTSPTDDPDPNDNTSTVPITPGTRADLQVGKSADVTSAAPGEVIAWTIDVTNHGPSTSREVVLTDVVPEGLVIESVPAECVVVGQEVTCALGDLARDATVSVEVLVTVAEDADTDSFVNVAEVASGTEDPDPSNDSDSAEVLRDDPPILEIVKTADGEARVLGDGTIAATFLVTVRNTGDRAVDVEVTDELRWGEGIALVSATPRAVDLGGAEDLTIGEPVGAGDGPEIVLATGSLHPDVEVVLAVDMIADIGDLTDPAAADCTLTEGEDGTGLLDVATADHSALGCAAIPLAPALEVTKTADVTQADAGDTISYTITVASVGVGPVTDVVLTDEVPGALTDVRVSGAEGCELDGNLVTCALGVLTQGATAAVVVTALVGEDAAAGTLTNVASATGGGADPSSGSADVSILDPMPGTGANVWLLVGAALLLLLGGAAAIAVTRRRRQD